MVAPPFNQQIPTCTGAVHKSVTLSCGFMLVELNKCVVVCDSDFQGGIVVMGVCLRRFCIKNESSMGHLFVQSCARVQRMIWGVLFLSDARILHNSTII